MVGSFPKEAVRVIVPKAYDRSSNPYLPDVFTAQPMIKVLDPKMANIIAKIPFSVNGYKSLIPVQDPKTGKWTKQEEPPRVVPVPGRKDALPAVGGRP